MAAETGPNLRRGEVDLEVGRGHTSSRDLSPDFRVRQDALIELLTCHTDTTQTLLVLIEDPYKQREGVTGGGEFPQTNSGMPIFLHFPDFRIFHQSGVKMKFCFPSFK